MDPIVNVLLVGLLVWVGPMVVGGIRELYRFVTRHR